MAKQIKGLSKTTRELISQGETEKVDYKVKLNGLHAEDIVAFANSPSGGTILIGVKENRNLDGTQYGVIEGHTIGDRQELAILDKASQCIPPIKLSVTFENTQKSPIIRIDIDSGTQKPYCTTRGTYKIRDGNRISGIRPQQLLEMFIDIETNKFTSRFKTSTESLVKHMTDLSSMVRGLEDVIGDKIEDISSSMMMAEMEADDAASSARAVLGMVQTVKLESNENRKRIKSVVDKLEVIDPLIEEQKKVIRNKIVQYFNDKTPAELTLLIENREQVHLSIDPLPDALNQTHVDEVTQIVIDEVFEVLDSHKNMKEQNKEEG